jgi:hypothetical protein
MLEDGSEHTIKMSYGLFNDLQRTIPDAAAVVDTMLADPYTRDYVVRRCMSPLKKMIKDVEELPAIEDVGLDDPDQVDKILQWVTGHMLYFFATSAGGLKQLSDQFKVKMEQVLPAPSIAGSPA